MNIKNLSITTVCIIRLICKCLVIEHSIPIDSKILQYFQV
ncbi:hypothetical protein BTT_62020 (plasmid) [Bacillus thuringiensis serovar morrisoni str. 4AA1]|nr:hypothetical protein BTT_62020 [Bacillus thuringiensis serovar morrisoni str. 4AA1]